MFGIIRPCRHRLGGELGAAWQAHLCGMCLSLRDDHGQAARLATNYDGLVISVLAEAQADGEPQRRTAGRCALRGMRKADVAVGDCARLAATVSLVLAAAKIRDHADDGDGALGAAGGARRGDRARGPLGGGERALRPAARLRGRRADRGGRPPDRGRGGRRAGHGPAHRHRADRDRDRRRVRAHGGARRQAGQRRARCAEAGRLFGRIAHLVDAVEDLAADQAAARGTRCSPPARTSPRPAACATTRCSASSSRWTRPSSPTPGWCTRCWCAS